MNYSLESMTDFHRKPVIDIFNHYVRTGFAAYPETPVGTDFFDRLLEMVKGYPAVVVKTEEGAVVDFAFLHPYHPVSTFKGTAEITYSILPEHIRKGFGRLILDRFTVEGRKLGIDNLLASIFSRNEESLRFHRRHGFEECGRFREIGKKHGENFDVVWMQKRV